MPRALAPQAFGSAASLAAVLPAMRADANVSAVVAHNVFTCVARALDLQAQARAALVEAHGRACTSSG